MRLEGKPIEVRRAQIKHDHRALSAMGKKGAEHAAINRAVLKEEEKRKILEIALERAHTETISPDGDVLPPDQNAVDALENDLDRPSSS